jgi:phosphoglycolate phosphatase-like HAD superfamily hydrolase
MPIEVVNGGFPRGQVRHALFDFDGTLSLLREGWPGVMIPLMVECLRAAPRSEPAGELEALVRELVEQSTGRQTIFQMIWLAEAVSARGGRALEPLDYKQEYLRRLNAHIAGRLRRVESGAAEPAEFLVAGAREILEALRARGVTLYCASGTDQPDVRREAGLLGLAGFFEGRIWGAVEDPAALAAGQLVEGKKKVVAGIIAGNRLKGPELLVVGDGFVEIEEGKAAGGLAVGVATDESGRGGIDERKRRRLLAAGADLIVPDFREAGPLAACLFGE